MKWTHDVGIFIFGYSHVLWLVASFPIGLIIPLFSNTKVEYPTASTKMPSQVCKLVYVHQVNSVFVYIYMIYIYDIYIYMIYIYMIYIYTDVHYIYRTVAVVISTKKSTGRAAFILKHIKQTHTHWWNLMKHWWNLKHIFNKHWWNFMIFRASNIIKPALSMIFPD